MHIFQLTWETFRAFFPFQLASGSTWVVISPPYQITILFQNTNQFALRVDFYQQVRPASSLTCHQHRPLAEPTNALRGFESATPLHSSSPNLAIWGCCHSRDQDYPASVLMPVQVFNPFSSQPASSNHAPLITKLFHLRISRMETTRINQELSQKATSAVEWLIVCKKN